MEKALPNADIFSNGTGETTEKKVALEKFYRQMLRGGVARRTPPPTVEKRATKFTRVSSRNSVEVFTARRDWLACLIHREETHQHYRG